MIYQNLYHIRFTFNYTKNPSFADINAIFSEFVHIYSINTSLDFRKSV